jgi:hypothetical protein
MKSMLRCWLTLGIPARVRIAQGETEAPRFAARPCLDGIVSAGNKVALCDGVFGVITRPIGNVWIGSRHVVCIHGSITSGDI